MNIISFFITFIFSIILLFNPISKSFSAEQPKNWPWRGVVVDSCCGGVDESDIATLSSYGVNAVVLNINARQRAEITGERPEIAWEESLKWMDRMLDVCKMYNIVGIIRLTKLPIDPKSNIREYNSEFWENQKYLDDSLKLVELLASRYFKRGEELAAYAILTEPSFKKKNIIITPPGWTDYLNKIIKSIRKFDDQRYIVATPGPGGLPSSYKNYKPINDHAIIYNAHMYVPYPYTHQGIDKRKEDINYPGFINYKYWNQKALRKELEKIKIFQERHNSLIWIGEFGVPRYAPGSDKYLSDLIQIFFENNWSWTYFVYKANPIWDFREKIDVNKDWPDLVKKAAKTRTPGRFELLKNAWKNDRGQELMDIQRR